MNIFFITLIIFVLVYLLLNWFVKTSSAKISKGIRSFTIILSIVLAVIMSVCAFSFMDLLVKWSEDYPLGQVLFFRGFFGVVIYFF